jgi:hypothetical protein
MSEQDPSDPVIDVEADAPREVDTVSCPDCRGDGCELCNGSGTVTVERPAPAPE